MHKHKTAETTLIRKLFKLRSFFWLRNIRAGHYSNSKLKMLLLVCNKLRLHFFEQIPIRQIAGVFRAASTGRWRFG
jgi:hypothetical protein